MITTLRMATLALLLSLSSCTKSIPEPDYSCIENLTYTITQQATTTLVDASSASVYPNPFVGRMSVELYASVTKNAIIYISDEKGKYGKKIELEVLGRKFVHIEFGNMPKGIYLCEVEIGNTKKLFRLMKGK